MTKTSTTEAATILDLFMEVTIDADPAKVWAALTGDIARWWPGAFYCGGGAGTGRMVLEARPGGRMAEEWGDGDGLLWGTVIQAQRPSLLAVAGHSLPAFGGPSTWMGVFQLEAAGAGTRLRFTESAIGRTLVDVAGREKGWSFLFAGALKAFVEGRPEPAWED